MKLEQISDAIGEIDEDIIEAAANSRKKKNTRKPLIQWIALAACMCLIVTGVMAGRSFLDNREYMEDKEDQEQEHIMEETANETQKSEDIVQTEQTYLKGAIAQAVYPQMAAYPDEMSYINTDTGVMDSEGYLVAYDAWEACFRELKNQPEGYSEGMEDFFKKTIQEFLTGEDGENRVYSPLNVYMALSMLAEVTGGDSRQQILDLLGVEDMEALRGKVNALWEANYSDDGRVTSILGNSIWLNQNVAFQQPVLDTLAEYHYASAYQGVMGSEEMNQMLQDWLNEQTGGLLKEQASDIELSERAVMALASTIYFKARWEDEFAKAFTQEDVFHSPEGDITCDFMHQSTGRSYYEKEGFSAVAQSLQGTGDMWLILPDEDVLVNELLEGEELYSFLSSENKNADSKYLQVNLSVPKFDVVSSADLSEGLQQLGVLDVFDDGRADFTPMTDEESVYVSEVTHAARVKIDEEGCEAAAFTVIMMETTAALAEKEVDFVLDRPFIFVITGQDGLPLFAGVVNQPV